MGSKCELLEEMKKNPEVIKYLDLVTEIKRINDELDFYKRIYGVKSDTLENRIEWEFRLARGSCSHNIWVYAGSVYRYINHKNEEDYARYYVEDFGDCFNKFSYNQYVCLECNKTIRVEDYKRFEKEHIVLKKTGKYDNIDIDYYRGLYYQMLYYEYDFSEAESLIIEEFKNKEIKKNNNRLVIRKTKK